MSSPDKNKTSTLQVIQGVGLLILGIAIIAAATWVYLKSRDIFVMMVAGIVAIGSFMNVGVIVEQRDKIETTQYQILFSVSLVMGIIGTAVLAIFVARVLAQKKEKEKYAEVSSSDLGDLGQRMDRMDRMDPLDGLRI